MRTGLAGSMQRAFCLLTSTHCARKGANWEKSEAVRAATHACGVAGVGWGLCGLCGWAGGGG